MGHAAASVAVVEFNYRGLNNEQHMVFVCDIGLYLLHNLIINLNAFQHNIHFLIF
jgi:hypothetical protein